MKSAAPFGARSFIGASWRVLGCVAVLAALTAFAGCRREEPKPVARLAEVSVMKIEPRDAPITFEYIAQTQSSHEVEIRARVSGFLDKRAYTEGSVVKAGQVLYLMDRKPFQVQVEGAVAALARQRAAMETARLNLERTRPLAARNAVSKKDLDDATGTYETSAAAVEQAKAQLEGANLNLSYTTIVSPVSGMAGATLQQEGAYINPQNSQLTTVVALSPMWVNFSMSENEMKKYRDEIARGALRAPAVGDYVVEVVLVDGSAFSHTGRITFADPSYRAQTGTFLIRASVDNPNGVLRPNQYVRARLHGAVRPNAILVPQRSVQQSAKGHFVWIIGNESKAEPRPVVLGDWHANDIFIVEGLRPGDQVVVGGGLTLRAGESVTVKPVAVAPPAGVEPPKPGVETAPALEMPARPGPKAGGDKGGT